VLRVDILSRIVMAFCICKAFSGAATTRMNMESEETAFCFRKPFYFYFNDYAIDSQEESNRPT
jgi:hypothetical protein